MAILIFNPIRGTNEDWRNEISQALPDEDVRIHPDIGDPAEIEFLIFGRPALKELPDLPNLKLMMTMLAGVDAIAGNPLLPDVPLAKLEPTGGDPQMTEYCLLQVLRHHRQMPAYQMQQAAHNWNPLPQPPVTERRVGFLGFGTLAQPMSEPLVSLGFDVAAWSRSAKPDAPIKVFHGEDQFDAFLGRTDIAVAMLPLTAATRGILGSKAFAAMPQGAAIINLARGGLVNNEELIAALDSEHLAGATLDVTDPEPLNEDSPLWDHPKVTIMPHVARRPPASQMTPQAIDSIKRCKAGEPVQQLVNWDVGY